MLNNGNRTLYEELEYRNFDKNIIFFYNEITRYEIEIPIMNLLEMGRKSYIKPVIMYLQSPGGDAYGAFSLYDILNNIPNKVEIVCTGLVASAAAMIVLQAANRRVATKNTRFLLHEIKRWAFMSSESTSELEDEMKEMQILTTRIVEILAKKCGQTEDAVRKLIARKEVWFSADEALNFGLIDKII